MEAGTGSAGARADGLAGLPLTLPHCFLQGLKVLLVDDGRTAQDHAQASLTQQQYEGKKKPSCSWASPASPDPAVVLLAANGVSGARRRASIDR